MGMSRGVAVLDRAEGSTLHRSMDNQPGGYGERRGGFVRVESQEEEERRLTANGWFIQCGRRKLQVGVGYVETQQ